MLLYAFVSGITACILTEFAGYWIHRLLHSHRIEFLSRNHMIHHLVLYGPDRPLRTPQYLDATASRAALGNIGLEWLIPIGTLLIAHLVVFRLLEVKALYQIVYVASSLAWGYLMFSYMHDALHIENFWMERNAWLSSWFIKARKLHDIHHRELSDEGKMVSNFGICFFAVDRLVGTLSERFKPFNHRGLEAAKKLYAYALT
jgi:sterol desaturase/sphingolipid hydroxylase (fatty acid hydroxylase superfamily)